VAGEADEETDKDRAEDEDEEAAAEYEEVEEEEERSGMKGDGPDWLDRARMERTCVEADRTRTGAMVENEGEVELPSSCSWSWGSYQ